jgi:hypothetical protein
MAKIVLHTAQRTDITAKKDDDFDLSINITQSDGTGTPFYLGSIFLFSITDNENTPLLIACSADTDFDIQDDGPNSEEFGKRYRHTAAIGRILGVHAGLNTTLENNGYLIFVDPPHIFYSDTLLNLVPRTVYPGGDISPLMNDITHPKNNFIVKGTLSFHTTIDTTINIPYQDFNLPKGDYKYTFKALKAFGDELTNSSVLSAGYTWNNAMDYHSVRTVLYGKMKVV